VVKGVFWFIIGIFIFFILFAAAIQIPFFQTRIVKELSESVSERIQYPVTIQHVDLNWFDVLKLRGLYIFDKEQNLMIGVDDLLVDFDITTLVTANQINIDQATLTNADINLTKYSVEEEINVGGFIKSIKNWLNPDDEPAKRDFRINRLFLIDSKVRLNNVSKDSIHNGLDYHHFLLDSVNSEITDFKIRNDSIRLQILKMGAIEPRTSLKVHDFSTDFYFDNNVMAFRDLHVLLGDSEIQDSLVFNYHYPTALSSFRDSVHVVANFENSSIAASDLNLFVPALQRTDQHFILSGVFDGRIVAFDFSDVELRFGKDSRLMGNINMEGLPVFRDTFIDASLKNSVISPRDLRPFIGEQLYLEARKFGTIRLNSEFLGFPRDFVANGTFFTQLGTLNSDINLKIDKETQSATYSGALATSNFDLGNWTNKPDIFQKVALNGQIQGSGFTIEEADFELKANISNFGFYGYNYTNIETDARLAKELFIGKLKIDDPNLKFSSDAYVDVRKNVDHIAIEATLDTANLKPLNLTEKEAILSTYIDLDFTGLTLDEMVGFANLRNTVFTYDGQSVDLEHLEVISQKKADERRVSMLSDRFDLNAQGDFEFSELFSDVNRLIYEYRLNLINDQNRLDQYYQTKESTAHNKYRIDFTGMLKDVNPVVNLFEPQLSVSENTPVEGYFRHGFTSILAASSHISTLQFKNNTLHDVTIDVNTSKISDSTNVLAMAYFHSDEQVIGTLATTSDFSFEAIWNNDHIEFESNIEVKDYPENKAMIGGELEFQDDRSVLRFHESDFQALEQQWRLAPDNQISISGGEFDFKSLTLFHDDQSITVNGFISHDSSKTLLIEFNGFQVNNLNPILKYKLQGELNANVEFQNLYGTPLINSGLSIDAFQIGRFLVGDVTGKSSWNYLEKYFDVGLSAERNRHRILDIRGTYTPKTEDQLNLMADLNQANLHLIEPFIKETFSDLEGLIDGQLMVHGSLKGPKLDGSIDITDGRFKVNYLNTIYNYQGPVQFTENGFGVNNGQLLDENGNVAVINGGLQHTGFKNLTLDLSGDLSEFMVLNTANEKGSLYYGTAIVSGDINFAGPLDNFRVKATAISEKGSRIFIPINEDADVEQKDYINFVSFTDTVQIGLDEHKKKKVTAQGINLDFDLDITPDAYIEIIFDLQAGDIIRGRGSGHLNMLIDTQGDFNMFGEYVIQEGGYNFTLYNIINKEFNILPDSRISWYGDPYEGILDIKATYEQTADVSPLFNDQSETLARGRYPAIVELGLQGRLLSPEIDFDLYLGDNQTADPEITQRIQEIKTDEQALNRQVFSLIVLRAFSPPDDLSLGQGGALTGSVSELLSNQLSYWFSQVDENLEIDVDLNGLDQEALNTFQLRLSYTFLDGRLRVTREGGFTNTVENTSDFSSVAGDWTLEYLLSPDGKFRAKMYNRNTYNAINSGIGNSNTTSAGFSLIHTQSFNSVNELFSRKDKNANTQDVSLNSAVPK
jgi:hypothetical protein